MEASEMKENTDNEQISEKTEEKEVLSLVGDLQSKFKISYEIRDNFLLASTAKDSYPETARYLKEQGFKRLLTVSAIDWMEEKEFEVYFVVHNMATNTFVKLATRIDRADPRIESLSTIWKNAAMHEREAWELFGIEFEGNGMLKPLFLEDWKGLPPLRKDFNWRKYVKETYDVGEG